MPAVDALPEQPAVVTSERILSLDAFRGATIALMILVNTPGDGHHTFYELEHAGWHGWTWADTVFPAFVWIVGVSIVLALGKKLAAGVSKGAILKQVLRRAAILYGLGVFLYLLPHFDFSTARLMGVLQRIAICFLCASAIYLWTSWRGQIAWTAGLLIAYWLLMFYAPTPGYGPGRLDVEGNFAHYVDRVVLGNHNYAETKTWDPEGIVSTLPAIASALLGVLAGQLFLTRRPLVERIARMFAMGAALLAAGLIAHQWLPINKKLWTSSFTLFMAGMDAMIFAACLWLMDWKGYRRWAKPLVIFGSNAIAIYLIADIVEGVLTSIHTAGGLEWKAAIFEKVFAPLASPKVASLLYALTYVLFNYLIAWWMYRRRWFLKI